MSTLPSIFRPRYHISRDEKRLYYATNFSGNAPGIPLVFNYGLACSQTHFIYQIEYFAERMPVLVHDLRGHFNSGGSDDIPSLTFENFALDLHEILNETQTESAIMIGHSMGVNVTLEFAARFPETVAAMILISGTVRSPDDVMFNSDIFGIISPLWEKVSLTFPKVYRTLWKYSSWNPLVVELVKRGGFHPDKVSSSFVQSYLSHMGQLSPELFFQCLNQMKEHDIKDRIKDLKTPTLVMGGDRDQIIPNHTQKDLVDLLTNSEFYLIKDGSHVPQVDFPDSVNERIELFLKTQGLYF